MSTATADSKAIKIGIGVIVAVVIVWGMASWGSRQFIQDEQGRFRDPSECVQWGVRFKDARTGEVGVPPLNRTPQSRDEAEEMAEALEQQSQGLRDYEVFCQLWEEYKGVPDRPKGSPSPSPSGEVKDERFWWNR